jgi:hypothetical protein
MLRQVLEAIAIHVVQRPVAAGECGRPCNSSYAMCTYLVALSMFW